MEKNLYEAPTANLTAMAAESAPALWNPNAAGLWSVLFTPAFGSYLLMKNCQAMGDEENRKSAKIWFIASVLLIIPSFMVSFLGVIYLVVWYFLWQKKQFQYVQARWGDTYPRQPWGVPLTVAFVLLFVFTAVIGTILVSAAA